MFVGYDARTGRERWTQPAGAHRRRSRVRTDGRASRPEYFPVRDVSTGEVFGVDPRTGHSLWSVGIGLDPIRASTTDLLVTRRAGADGDLLEGVDRTTGQPRWSYEVHGNRQARLVAASDDLIAVVVGDPPAASFEGADRVGVTLHVLSATTGQLQREIPLPLTTPQKLAIDHGRAVRHHGRARRGQLVAFDSISGVERWRAPGRLDPALPAHTGSGGNGPILVRTGAGTGAPVSITALAPATGRQRWVRDLGPSISGAAAARSNVVVFERDGYRAVNAATGQRRWKVDPEPGVVGVPGMTGRDFFLVGGCPLTSAD